MQSLNQVLLVGFAFAVTSLPAAPSKVPIILDTGIGTDIDDAFALALVINSPELELLGVTTVAGDRAPGVSNAGTRNLKPGT
jgi:thiazole synthase ThiGH ThiG subunit